MKVPKRHKAISGDTAEIIVDILKDALDYADIQSPRKDLHFVGKTGTSNDSKDAWFIGIIPYMTMVVWLGYDNPSFGLANATGTELAAPLWVNLMQEHLASIETKELARKFKFSPRAQKLKLCPSTGQAYNHTCPSRPSWELLRSKAHLAPLAKEAYKNPELKTKRTEHLVQYFFSLDSSH